MTSENKPVERAIRSCIHRGQVLLSPGKGYPPRTQKPFEVLKVSNTGIKINKLLVEIRFDVLESAVSRVRSEGGKVPIGSQQVRVRTGYARAVPERRLTVHDTRTSTYVAPILVESRIAELRYRNRVKQSASG